MLNRKELQSWLDAHPVARWALARVTLALLGVLFGVLGTLGLVEPSLVDALQRALGQ